MRAYILIIIVTVFAAGMTGCTNDALDDDGAVYPQYVDENANGINDYVEAVSHTAGAAAVAVRGPMTGAYPAGHAGRGHGFTDGDGDGICDYAQNGSTTWHGPGFVDEDGNGVCDYWDEGNPRHNRHDGMRFRDQNQNRINDYMEESFHMGGGHGFVDENGDGICDFAQNGGPNWHGPNFVDNDNDGVCDYWQNGGRGHGGRHGHHAGGGNR